jgi:hypothetical protein
MFVRWNRTHFGKWVDADRAPGAESIRGQRYREHWLKTASLLKSVRTPVGPRQKHIRYLGSIRENWIDRPSKRMDFWMSVESKLKAARIVGKQRQTIETALNAVVAKPTQAELAAERDEAIRASRHLCSNDFQAGAGDQAGDEMGGSL